MLVVVASPSESTGPSNTLEVLLQWQSAGLLQEFLWCEKRAGSLEPMLITLGTVMKGVLSHLLSGVGGSLDIIEVVDSDGQGDSLRRLESDLQGMTDIPNLRSTVKLVIPDLLGSDLAWLDALDGHVIVWAPEDRADPSLFSTVLDGSHGPRAAHAIASLGHLWTMPGDHPGYAEIFNHQGQDGRVNLARAFTRLAWIRKTSSALYTDLSVEGDDVPRPTGQFDRMDFSEFVSGLADYFISTQEAILPLDPNNYLLTEKIEDTKFLGQVVKKLLDFFKRLPAVLAKQVAELVIAKIHDELAEEFEKGTEYKIFRWHELQEGAFDEFDSLMAKQGHVDSDLRNRDGKLFEFWKCYYLSAFSLIDGGDYDWGDKLPPHDVRTRPVVNSRLQVIGAPTSSLQADEPATESSTPSYLVRIHECIETMHSDATDDLAKLQVELAEANSAITSILQPAAPPTPPKGLKKLWAFLRHQPPEYENLSTINSELKRAIARIFSIRFVLGVICTLALVVLLPAGAVVAVIAAIAFAASILAGVVREIWRAEVAYEKISAQLAAASARKYNAFMKTKFASEYVDRLARRLSELPAWEEILRSFVARPFPRIDDVYSGDIVNIPLSTPLAFLKAEVSVSEKGQKVIRDRFVHSLFEKGWMAKRFDVLRETFLRDERPTDVPGISELVPENDPTTESESLRNLFANYVVDYVNSEEAAVDLWKLGQESLVILDFVNDASQIDGVDPIQPVGVLANGESVALAHSIPRAATLDEYFLPLENVGPFDEVLFKSSELRNHTALNESPQGYEFRFSSFENTDASRRLASPLTDPWMMASVIQFSRPLKPNQFASKSDE